MHCITVAPREELQKLYTSALSSEAARAEGDQRRSRPDKRLLREEIVERRGTSAKRPLSEEVAQQGSHSSIHAPPMKSFIRSFTDLLMCSQSG